VRRIRHGGSSNLSRRVVSEVGKPNACDWRRNRSVLLHCQGNGAELWKTSRFGDRASDLAHNDAYGILLLIYERILTPTQPLALSLRRGVSTSALIKFVNAGADQMITLPLLTI
jgi:hypothetical protein